MSTKTNAKKIKLSPTKGRPMLHWVGKKPLTNLPVFPAQHVETFDPTNEGNKDPNKLFHGDNKEVLAHLLANGYRGKVNLIYIDPPFDSGADYIRKVKLRGPSAIAKMEGEANSLGEQIQYSDIWANDNYLQFMFDRLILLKELLAEGGCIFVHCDSTKSHFLRLILDEIFGQKAFINEIIWSYRRWPSNSDNFQTMHDTIFAYGKAQGSENKSGFHTFHKQYEDASESYLKRFGGKTQILDESTGTRKITSEEDTKGMPLRDVWDISILAGVKAERTSYPTQKPEELLARILEICSNPNDLILDCFIGSGTTAAVAQKLGRRWIACDINKGAIQTTSKRIQNIIQEQAATLEEAGTKELIPDENAPPKPASLAFQVHRVNDYDLQIQHNEAVALACEHIGVESRKNDTFFDGIQGKKLVKVTPFNHPLSPADLELLKEELKTREEEERDILVICLGKEPKTEDWLRDWNRLRKKGDVPNKIEVIELRTDEKYGKFIQHTPATAEISFKRSGKEVTVTIEDFISPTILERIDIHSGSLVKAHITDWRSMVDCILIDADHNGETFQITQSDIPTKKTDLVTGTYTLETPKDKTIAIKIIDMLGEELTHIIVPKS